jgi:hypothetical protein
MSIRVFDDGGWKVVKSAYIYHEGIGFVTMSSIRCFAHGEWRVVSVGDKELIGV